MPFVHCAASKVAAAALFALAPIAQAYADVGHASGIGEPGSAAQAARAIQVTLYDNYFEPEQISVTAGETVRLVIVNRGDFVHEFNIGTAAMHAEHQAEMQVMFEHGMIDAERINHDMMQMDMGGHSMAHDDPNSVLLEPGQSAQIVWTFPDDGALEFACNIPGHYQVGMVGPFDIGS